MHCDSSKSISRSLLLRRSLSALLVCASLFAARAGNAQTTIYNNTNATNELFYGGSEDYDALYAFTVIGTDTVTSNPVDTSWRVSSMEIALYNASASAHTDQVLTTFYYNMDVAATGSTVVNSTPLVFLQLVTPVTLPGHTIDTLTITSTGGIFYLPNAYTGATYGMELAITNSSETAFDTSIHPELTYEVTTGSNPADFLWETSNQPTLNDNTYLGSNALATSDPSIAPNDYNLFLQLNAVAVPAPNALAVLVLGSMPILSLLRRRRRK